ncbi:hypothetical protein Cpir12675_006993, partial [Ceratocystis pirilliformis]
TNQHEHPQQRHFPIRGTGQHRHNPPVTSRKAHERRAKAHLRSRYEPIRQLHAPRSSETGQYQLGKV